MDDALVTLIWARDWAVGHEDYCKVCGNSQNEDCPQDEWCGVAYEIIEGNREFLSE